MTDKLKVYYIGLRDADNLEDTKEEIEKIGAEFIPIPKIEDENELIAAIKDADGLIDVDSPMTRNILSSLDKCKVVLRTGVGFDVIDVEAATDNGIAVVNIPDMWTREVANQAMALMLALNRGVTKTDSVIRESTWTPLLPYPVGPLHEETAGIIGLGRIGSAMARRCQGFELSVIGYDPYLSDADFEEKGVERVSLEELLKRSDYISLHTPLNEDTRHILSEDQFKQMKPNALVINTSRGPVVDEVALIRALQAGQIAGAGLDVLEKEPPEADNPLLSMDNVVLSPHSGHYSNLSMAIRPRRYGSEVARVLRGVRPVNLVNPQVLEVLHLTEE